MAANDFRVIFQGAAEAANRYGGGGGDAPGMEGMPEEVKAGFANLQREMQRRVPPLTAFFKSMGIEVSIKSMLKQSQIFTSYVGTIFQLMGALVDVMLAPLLPLLIPVARWIGSKIPILAAWARKKGEEISAKLTPISDFLKNHTWDTGWEKAGNWIREKMDAWSIPFLGKWGESLAGWFGDHPGWAVIGGVLGAVLAKKFVFALPGLALKLGWGSLKAISGAKAAPVIDDVLKVGGKGGSFGKWGKVAKFLPWLFAASESIGSVAGFEDTADIMGTKHSATNTGLEIGSSVAFAGAGTAAFGGAAGALPLFMMYAMGDQFQGYMQANENLKRQVASMEAGMNKQGDLFDPANDMMMISKFLTQQNMLQTGGTPFPMGTWEESNYLNSMDWKAKLMNMAFPTDFGKARYEPAPATLGSTMSQQRDVQGSTPYIVFTLQNSDGAPTDSYSMPFISSWAFQHGMQLEEQGQNFSFQIHNHGVELD